MGFWTIVSEVIRKSDIVVLVIDARTPEMSKNDKLMALIKRYDRPIVSVYNKVDLVSNEKIKEIRQTSPDALFVSAIKNLGIRKLKVHLLIMGKRMGRDAPKIGIVGYPNVGKSAIINALAKRARTVVTSRSGTTRKMQRVKAGSLNVIDSPGVVPLEDSESKLGFIGAKNPEKIRNPEKVALEIIKYLRWKSKEALEGFYGVKYEDDAYETMLSIGKKRGFLMKGGKIDEYRTALQIIRDWQSGRLREL